MGFLAALALLFAVGTWEFWLACIILGGIVTILVENEEGTWATLVAIGTIVGLNYVSKVPLFSFLAEHPIKVAGLILSYLVIGAFWSAFKWVLYTHKWSGRYDTFKDKFLRENGVKDGVITPVLASQLQDKLASKPRQYDDETGEGYVIPTEPLIARENKSRLVRWMTYFPFSMVGFVLNDFVRKVWNHIYNMLQSTYQRISDHAFRNVTADMKMAEEYKAQAAAAGKGGSTTTTSDDTPNRKRGW